MAKSSTGMSNANFDKLLAQMESGLRTIMSHTADTVTKLLLKFATQLATCSPLQLQIVRKRLAPFGVGFQMNDRIDKVIMVGKGDMAPKVAYMPGVSAKTFAGLVKSGRVILNNDTPRPIKLRNQVLVKKPSLMTEREQHQLVRHFPTPAVLPLNKQREPRPRPVPTYYQLIGWEVDPATSTIIAAFELKSSSFKGRLSATDLQHMLKAVNNQKTGS